MTDSTGEWEVVGRPYTTAGGKSAHVRVQRVDNPGVTETRMGWRNTNIARMAGKTRGLLDALASSPSVSARVRQRDLYNGTMRACCAPLQWMAKNPGKEHKKICTISEPVARPRGRVHKQMILIVNGDQSRCLTLGISRARRPSAACRC